jgi:hypothetical protein
MKRRVIVLVSGGLDSVCALYETAATHKVVAGLSFKCGAKHKHHCGTCGACAPSGGKRFRCQKSLTRQCISKAGQSKRLLPPGYRTGNLFEIGDAPFGSITDQ